MRRTLLILAAIAAIVAVEFVWLAPATLASRRLEKATDGALRLSDTEGTIWHARGMLIAGASRLPVAWDLEFWPLLKGEMRVHITPFAGTRAGPPRADLVLREESVSVRDAEIILPAPVLAALVTLPSGWTVGGDVRVTTAAFEWSPSQHRGDARITWLHARASFATDAQPVDFGTVNIELDALDNGVGGPIRNDGGALSMQGEWAWRTSVGAVATLVLEPRSSTDPALANMLAALGPGDGGRWRVEWRLPAR